MPSIISDIEKAELVDFIRQIVIEAEKEKEKNNAKHVKLLGLTEKIESLKVQYCKTEDRLLADSGEYAKLRDQLFSELVAAPKLLQLADVNNEKLSEFNVKMRNLKDLFLKFKSLKSLLEVQDSQLINNLVETETVMKELTELGAISEARMSNASININEKIKWIKKGTEALNVSFNEIAVAFKDTMDFAKSALPILLAAMKENKKPSIPNPITGTKATTFNVPQQPAAAVAAAAAPAPSAKPAAVEVR